MIGQTQLGEPRNQKIRTAIGLLMEGKDYAEDTGCDCWDFAVSIEQLCRFNINESDLRWLVKKNTLTIHVKSRSTVTTIVSFAPPEI